MRIEHLASWPRGAAEREALRTCWNGLLAAAGRTSIFQSFEWHDAWWETFAGDAELHLLVVRDDGRGSEPVAIAPMMLSRTRRRGVERRVLRLIGTANHASDYADFIVARGHARARNAILAWIAGQRGRWTHLAFDNVPAGSPTLPALASVGWAPLTEVSALAPARLLGDAEDDARTVGKKSLRRHTNWFQRQGVLSFARLTEPSDIAAQLEPFFEQHVQRWAGTPTPSLFNDPAQRVFYRRLGATLGDRLHFTVLRFDGRPIAFHFGFECDRVLVWYKPSFDPALERRSPGEVLIRHLLEDAIARELSEIDFTVGSEPFKFRFANVVRSVQRVRIYHRAWERVPALLRDRAKRTVLAVRERSLRPSPDAGPSA